MNGSQVRPRVSTVRIMRGFAGCAPLVLVAVAVGVADGLEWRLHSAAGGRVR